MSDRTLDSSAVPIYEELVAAFQSVSRMLLEERNDEGFWEGQLSASALSTATAISALSFFLTHASDLSKTERLKIESQVNAGFSWLTQQQNSDGGFGDTDKSYSNISTAMLVIAATHAAKRADECSAMLERTQAYVDNVGGIPALRKRYGKDKTFAVPILANCAMAGIVPWKEVAVLPFEASVVPQRFYNLMQLPVVSYAIPALVAIGQAKFVNDPPWNPVARLARWMSVSKSLSVLNRMQPASGGFLEAVPLTSFVAMGLLNAGQGDHPVVKNCIRFILESFREESEGGSEGSWPIDTNLATWNTTLTINAISNLQTSDSKADLSFALSGIDWLQTTEWVLGCQNTTIHPFTGAQPGGWGWTNLSGAVPDADDTPGALIALANILQRIDTDDCGDFSDEQKQVMREKIDCAAESGVKWLIDLQNRDKGWPTFCRGWGKLPFDRSGLDITAHAIRGLLAWQKKFDSARLQAAIAKGFQFLHSGQNEDGSWLPLWFGNQDALDDINPCYGTAKVLMAYAAAKSFDTKAGRSGLRWVLDNQNSDGGWGGGSSIQRDENLIAILGTSSVEETALCTEALLAAWGSNLDFEDEIQAAAMRGVQWMVEAVRGEQVAVTSPIGFYFAKLWYHEQLYPLIFATGALAGAIKHVGQLQQYEHNSSLPKSDGKFESQ